MLVNKKKIFYLKLTALFFIVFMAVIFISPHILQAQINAGLAPLGQKLGPAVDIRVIIARIIRIALGFLGIIAVVVILYGGFIWMTSGGNEEKISQAKKILINGAIGATVVFAAFGITSFILNSLLRATGVEITTPGAPVQGGRGGTLGYGIIESHYPVRDAKGVPRNTKIVITFKEAIKLSTIIKDGDDEGTALGDTSSDRLLKDNIKIFKSVEGKDKGVFVEASAMVTKDHRTFIFKPLSLLGSASESVSYTVFLTANIKKDKDDSAFSSQDKCGDAVGYCWDFEVSTFLDTTPPRVVSIFPLHTTDETKKVPRNSLVQINFSEAVDPLSAAGIVPGFNNISLIKESDQAEVSGRFRIANGYKTVEFSTKPNGLCGVNSCGGEVYCLDGDDKFTATVRAASLSANPPEAIFNNGYDGVVDMASNSLDGDNNGTAAGPPADNFVWNFFTSDLIDLEPPKIEKIIHIKKDNKKFISPSDSLPASLVHLTAPLQVIWSKLMMFSTLNNSHITITPGDSKWYGWFEPSADNFIKSEPAEDCTDDSDCSDAGYPVCKDGVCSSNDKTLMELRHSPFFEDTEYTPKINSQVKDIFQNCFYSFDICEKEKGKDEGICSLSGQSCKSDKDCGEGRPEGPQPSGIE